MSELHRKFFDLSVRTAVTFELCMVVSRNGKLYLICKFLLWPPSGERSLMGDSCQQDRGANESLDIQTNFFAVEPPFKQLK